jgi:hypothetical protein
MARTGFDLNDPVGRAKALEREKHVVRIRNEARRTVAAEDAATRPPPVLIYDGEEDCGPVDWLIDGVLPAEGAGMLFGETDLGKTFVALDMAIPVSAALPWHGRAVAHGTVLFIEAEGGRSFALRKHAAKLEAGVDPSMLMHLPFITVHEPLGFGPDTDPALVEMRAAAIRGDVATRQLPPIRFVVADTLAQNIHGNADDNADMSAFMRLFRAFLKALSAEPVFGLLIHHPGHSNKERARGAYALPADLDAILHLEGEEGAPGVLTLSCDRMRESERFPPILLGLEKRSVLLDDGSTTSTLVVVPRAESDAKSAEKPDERIVKHLRLHPKQTTMQISTDLHITKHIVVKVVDALVESGILIREEQKGPTGQTKQLYSVRDEKMEFHDAGM